MTAAKGGLGEGEIGTLHGDALCCRDVAAQAALPCAHGSFALPGISSTCSTESSSLQETGDRVVEPTWSLLLMSVLLPLKHSLIPLVCFQGGPWEDDLHHNVHQRELASVSTSSFCVPIPL